MTTEQLLEHYDPISFARSPLKKQASSENLLIRENVWQEINMFASYLYRRYQWVLSYYKISQTAESLKESSEAFC